MCTELLQRYGIYIQAINPPTVPSGQELLRLVPTPHHTEEMMGHLVNSLLSVWQEIGLPLGPPRFLEGDGVSEQVVFPPPSRGALGTRLMHAPLKQQVVVGAAA